MSLVSTPTWRPQVPASCWRRGRARATPRSGRAPTSCWHPCHRARAWPWPARAGFGGRGQRRRRGAPGNAALAALLRAEDCRVIEADPAGEGMGTSLATAARHLLALPGTRARGAGGAGGHALDSPRQHGGRAGCAATCADGGAVASGTARPSRGIPRGPAASAGAVERGRGRAAIARTTGSAPGRGGGSRRVARYRHARRPGQGRLSAARPRGRRGGHFRAPGFPYLSVR